VKLQFLPALPIRVWGGLWVVAMIGILGNWLGSRWLGLFAFSDDVHAAGMIAMLLLAFTPLYYPPRTVWAVMTRSGWVEVPEQEAQRLAQEPPWVVRRLVVQGDKVLEQHEV
jgi:hypothetical protein